MELYAYIITILKILTHNSPFNTAYSEIYPESLHASDFNFT